MNSSLGRNNCRLAAASILMLVSGCFSPALLTTVAPMVAAGSAQLIGGQVAMRDSSGTGVPEGDQSDRCDQLLRVPPGVEQVRKTPDGVIESRQWKIAANAGAPTWTLVSAKTSPEDSWQLKPNITKLNFKPPLYEMLEPKKPQYLAYAPATVEDPSDSEQFDSMTSAFGAATGTFEWRGRTYSYVVVKDLPCFKPAK
ncbi:MAG: hypothetical protein JWM69_1286 [Candidatus Binatus sp.]|jgi:hypothetical protein|nr:hypothetical protein [Candidatus Binatus sp.]